MGANETEKFKGVSVPQRQKEEESCRNQCWLLWPREWEAATADSNRIDPVDQDGHIIMDFSIYDAKRAGFEKVVFIIKKAIEKEFKESIGNRVSQYMDVSYVYQELDTLPDGFEVPKGREKPFGTGHAILSCKGIVDGPFAVVNADDYYGVHAFRTMYDYLSTHADDDKYRYAMVGYILENTLTENGYVSRGICETDADGYLSGITERTHIEKRDGGVAFTEDDGANWTPISGQEYRFDEYVWIHGKHAQGTGKPFPGIFGKRAERESDEMRVFPAVRGGRADRGRKSDGESAEINRPLVWDYL